MKRRNDQRARAHPAYWAFLVHRLSGLALALFLPLHFWALGQALQGEAALDGFLRWPTSRWSSSPNGAWWCCWRCTWRAACACC